MMKIIRIVAMFAFAIMAVVLASEVTHAEFKWVKFGADPYASTRAEAMKTREDAFKRMGLPAPVIAEFLKATERPGEKTRLNVGDRLSAMIFKGGVVRHDVIVAFGSPVRGMEYAAPAEKWQVTWEGKIYTVFLPEVCFNWSSKTPLPLKQKFVLKDCPKGWSIIANAWSLNALPREFRYEAEKHIQGATVRESRSAIDMAAYGTDAFSRTLGKRLREEIKLRAPVDADIIVRDVNIDLRTNLVTSTVDAGILKMVNGIGTFRFPNDPRQRVIELAWPNDKFLSPAISGGERRIRIMSHEWGTFCSLNVHGATP